MKKRAKRPRKTKDSPERLARKAEIREERRLAKAAEEAQVRKALIDECVKRIGKPQDQEAFREVLTALVENNAIPPALLTTVPQRAGKAGKTRFDQLYDACMFLAFPAYRPSVVDKAFGPKAPPEMRYWRAMFPKEFDLSHVVLRASSFQEAFGLACDYACRLSLRQRNCIPADLSIRVKFIPDVVASRILDIRRAVRDQTRRASNLRGKKYSPKDVHGARLVAIGRRDGDNYSIFKYADYRDLVQILSQKEEIRVSAVDVETFRPKRSSTYDEP